VKKNLTMYRLEEERGQDIRQIIWDAIQQHGRVEDAAREEFGITEQALRGWISDLEGSTRNVTRQEVAFDGWEPADAEPQEEQPAVA
jgi:hypothetical protein